MLLRVELPNALPLIMSGLRAAVLQVVATATIAAYVALGGLGRFIIDGLALRDFPQMARRRDPRRAARRGARRRCSPLVQSRRLAGSAGPCRCRGGPAASPASPTPSTDPDAAPTASPDSRPTTTRRRDALPDRTDRRRGTARPASTLGLAACGASSDPLVSGSADLRRGAGGTIVVGSANFTESQLLAEIYAAALKAKGVDVDDRLNIGSREVYIQALEDGSIDLVPEYTGVLLQYFDKAADRHRPRRGLHRAAGGAAARPRSCSTSPPPRTRTPSSSRRDSGRELNLKSIADLGRAVRRHDARRRRRSSRPARTASPACRTTYGCTFKEFTAAHRRR